MEIHKKISSSKIDEVQPQIGYLLNKYPDSELEYACSRFVKSCNKVTSECNKEIRDWQVKLATKENSRLIKDQLGTFVYSEENQLSLDKKMDEIKNKEFDFEPIKEEFLIIDMPKGIPRMIVEDLLGYVFHPDCAKKYE